MRGFLRRGGEENHRWVQRRDGVAKLIDRKIRAEIDDAVATLRQRQCGQQQPDLVTLTFDASGNDGAFADMRLGEIEQSADFSQDESAGEMLNSDTNLLALPSGANLGQRRLE